MKTLSKDLFDELQIVLSFGRPSTIKTFINNYYFETDDDEFYSKARDMADALPYIKEYFKDAQEKEEIPEPTAEDFMFVINTKDDKQCRIVYDLMSHDKNKIYDPEVLHQMYTDYTQTETPLSSIRRAVTSLFHSNYLVQVGKRQGKFGVRILTYKISNKSWKGIDVGRISVFTLKSNVESKLVSSNSSNIVALLSKIHETFMNCNNKIISKGRWDELYSLLSKIQYDLEQAEKLLKRLERRGNK